jgi:imidazole glycerol-phosphate synthase subunit HisF
MIPVRVIPCLLLRKRGLVKTVRFKDPTYVGDPINAVKIFNDKQVDELIFVDISATPQKSEPPFEQLKQIGSECFMPFAYGGGVTTMGHFHALFSLGVEKVCVNTHAVKTRGFLAAAAREFGSQSVVAAIDVKKKLIGGYEARTHGGRVGTGMGPVELARRFEEEGAGEIFLNDIDRDGTMSGYNIDLIKSVTDAVGIPVVACGGARNAGDLSAAITDGGASAAAAGSMFVFMGKHRAVLINYPVPSGQNLGEVQIHSRY